MELILNNYFFLGAGFFLAPFLGAAFPLPAALPLGAAFFFAILHLTSFLIESYINYSEVPFKPICSKKLII